MHRERLQISNTCVGLRPGRGREFSDADLGQVRALTSIRCGDRSVGRLLVGTAAYSPTWIGFDRRFLVQVPRLGDKAAPPPVWGPHRENVPPRYWVPSAPTATARTGPFGPIGTRTVAATSAGTHRPIRIGPHLGGQVPPGPVGDGVAVMVMTRPTAARTAQALGPQRHRSERLCDQQTECPATGSGLSACAWVLDGCAAQRSGSSSAGLFTVFM